MTGDILYSLREVSFQYAGKGLDVPVPALARLTTDLERGRLIVLAGANASGKTTLARILAGLALPSSGKLIFDGQLVGGTTRRPLEGVFVIFQNLENTFVAPTVEEDIAFGLENLQMSPTAIRKAVDDALETVGLKEYSRHHPASLSGGQKQLAALAGAIVFKPSVLILDESTSYLDRRHRELVIHLLQELRSERETTVLLITHEPEEMWLADHLLVLEGGCLAYDGRPEGLLLDPGRCRSLRLESDPLVGLSSCLMRKGLSPPPGRPTVSSLEEWFIDQSR